MGVKTTTCYLVVADCCGKILEVEGFEDSRYIPHLDTEAEALALLAADPDDLKYDFSRDDYEDSEHYEATMVDGKVWCWRCLIPKLCRERGHRWSDWRECLCTRPFGVDGPVPARIESHAGGCPRLRECRRCDRSEEEFPVAGGGQPL